jgi:hypothetical protein
MCKLRQAPPSLHKQRTASTLVHANAAHRYAQVLLLLLLPQLACQ